MIYDCFPFFNELDILDIRLHELDPVVDKFVLVEATRTFQKQPKPLYYAENRQRFKQFSHRIIHIVVDKYPGFFAKFRIPHAWDYDNYQKDQGTSALTQCQAGDTILISDLDEIPAADKVAQYADTNEVKVFEQRLSNFYVYWRGSVMVNYHDFTSFKKVRLLRNSKESGIIHIPEGGWHFSFMGGVNMVRMKLDSWAHTKEKKYNPDHLQDKVKLLEVMNNGQDLFGRDFEYRFFKLDESYPAYQVQNQERFAALIRTDTG